MHSVTGAPVSDKSRSASSLHACGDSYVADPNRALFESVVRLLAPVLDELVFVVVELTTQLQGLHRRLPGQHDALRPSQKECKSGVLGSIRHPGGPRGLLAVVRRQHPLLDRIQNGDIDPSFVITHRMPLSQAAKGYDMFVNKEDHCEKVVLSA